MNVTTKVLPLVCVLAVLTLGANDTTIDGHTLVHIDQKVFYDLVKQGKAHDAFMTAFNAGDEIFATDFNPADGGGANVGDGTLYTTVPRADLNGPGQWGQHFPKRETGPNAKSCVHCHGVPAEDGASDINVIRDPGHTAKPALYISRNTPGLFGLGALQRLAEEMTDDLQTILKNTKALSCKARGPVPARLTSKGISFGSITVSSSFAGGTCVNTVNIASITGVSPDLIVRPFQWKGSVAFIRDFNRGALHNEIGMQAVEIVGDGQDGDFDGVTDEVSVGGATAVAIYNAAQPRPTTTRELAALGLAPALTRNQENLITRGQSLFAAISCTRCHTPALRLNNAIFSEPSQSPYYRDSIFPAGQSPRARFVDSLAPITFDLTKDQPFNKIKDANGNVIFSFGSFESDGQGGAIIRPYSDLRRHDMGPGLAEPIHEAGTGASVFLTRALWGVGSTAPYMHDGKSPTLDDAIRRHGGEAQFSRDLYVKLTQSDRDAIAAFLNDLVLFKMDE